MTTPPISTTLAAPKASIVRRVWLALAVVVLVAAVFAIHHLTAGAPGHTVVPQVRTRTPATAPVGHACMLGHMRGWC